MDRLETMKAQAQLATIITDIFQSLIGVNGWHMDMYLKDECILLVYSGIYELYEHNSSIEL